MFPKNIGSCFAPVLSTVSNVAFELLAPQASDPHSPFTGFFLGFLLPVTSALLSLTLSHTTLVESLHTSCPSLGLICSLLVLVLPRHSGILWLPLPFLTLFTRCGCHRESCDCPLTDILLSSLNCLGDLPGFFSGTVLFFNFSTFFVPLYSAGEKPGIKVTFSITYLQVLGSAGPLTFFFLM